MSELSNLTLSVLAEAGQNLGASDLTAMLRAAGIYESDPGGTGPPSEDKAELTRSALLAARAKAQAGNDAAARRGMLAFAADLVQRTVQNPERPPPWFTKLRDALLADGYELAWDGRPTRTHPLYGDIQAAAQGSIQYAIRPAAATPAGLTGEAGALEAELAKRGYTNALTRYRQAVDEFTSHDYESASGDLGTALDDLITRLAEDHAGFQRQDRANQGGAAISHMIQNGHLREDIRGLWKYSQASTTQPGQSGADAAQFRMQVITATARFLLRRFPAAT